MKVIEKCGFLQILPFGLSLDRWFDSYVIIIIIPLSGSLYVHVVASPCKLPEMAQNTQTRRAASSFGLA